MQIDPKEIKGKPTKIGILKGKPVYELRLKGGLFVAVCSNKVIGTGSHRGISRHIAKRHEPEIEWTELSKSSHVPIEHFALSLDKYEALTEALANMQVNVDG
jgi:hypothetical protein